MSLKTKQSFIESDWTEVVARRCPRFRHDRTVLMPNPRDPRYSDFKIMFGFDFERHMTAWVAVEDRAKGGFLHSIQFTFIYYGNQIRELKYETHYGDKEVTDIKLEYVWEEFGAEDTTLGQAFLLIGSFGLSTLLFIYVLVDTQYSFLRKKEGGSEVGVTSVLPAYQTFNSLAYGGFEFDSAQPFFPVPPPPPTQTTQFHSQPKSQTQTQTHQNISRKKFSKSDDEDESIMTTTTTTIREGGDDNNNNIMGGGGQRRGEGGGEIEMEKVEDADVTFLMEGEEGEAEEFVNGGGGGERGSLGAAAIVRQTYLDEPLTRRTKKTTATSSTTSGDSNTSSLAVEETRSKDD